jgi:hypothetical protein
VLAPVVWLAASSDPSGRGKQKQETRTNKDYAQTYRATVAQDCITAYNDLKLAKKYKFVIYKLSDDYKEIVVEHTSTDNDWEDFRSKLINAKAKNRAVRTFWDIFDDMAFVVLTDDLGCRGQGPPLRCLRLPVRPGFRRWHPVRTPQLSRVVQY